MTQVKQGSPEKILKAALQIGALAIGDFVLSSGQHSTYYFDGRLLTLSPHGAVLVAEALLPAVRASGADGVGGPTLGADPMVSAMAMLSAQDGGRTMPAFVVRKGEKDHGTGRLIEGPLADGVKVAIVDDTCSTGGSLFHAIEAAEAAGHEVVLVACILDRHQGGSEELLRRGYRFHTILEADTDGNIRLAAVAE